MNKVPIPRSEPLRTQWFRGVVQAIADDIVAQCGPLDDGDGALVQEATKVFGQRFCIEVAQATAVSLRRYFGTSTKGA